MGSFLNNLQYYAAVATRYVSNHKNLFFWISIFLLFVIMQWYLSTHKSKDSCGHKLPFTQERFGSRDGGAPRGKLTGRVEGFAMVRVGDNSYKIHEDLQDPIKAAQTMDRLNTVAKSLIGKLYEKYIENSNGMDLIDDKYKKIVKEGIKDLKKNFVSANMEENIPERSGGSDTSYVIDTGDVFAMCLRDPKNGNQLDPKFNELTFVLIHELSHLAHKGYGHPNSFWCMFRFILQEAVEFGLYEKTNYKQMGSDYCGIVITYSPLYDSKLVDYKKVKIESTN